jgi:hypothetical protein
MLTCKIPKLPKNADRYWESVSVLEKEKCSNVPITNDLRLTYNVPPNGERKKFGVCVKGLYFPNEDISHRLIQWVRTTVFVKLSIITKSLFRLKD